MCTPRHNALKFWSTLRLFFTHRARTKCGLVREPICGPKICGICGPKRRRIFGPIFGQFAFQNPSVVIFVAHYVVSNAAQTATIVCDPICRPICGPDLLSVFAQIDTMRCGPIRGPKHVEFSVQFMFLIGPI